MQWPLGFARQRRLHRVQQFEKWFVLGVFRKRRSYERDVAFGVAHPVQFVDLFASIG